MKKLLLIIQLSVLSLLIKAQPFYFRNFQVEQGLSNNTVFCSVKDLRGFLWFGTRDGLNRFDGYNFKTYRNTQEKLVLGNNLIHSIDLDYSGILWLGTSNGVYKFDPKTEAFTFIEGTRKMEVYNIKADKQNNIWFTDHFILHKIKYNSNKIAIVPQNTFPFDASSIYISKIGIVYITSPDGTIKQFDKKEQQFKSYTLIDKPNKLNSKWISKICQVNNDEFLVGTMSSGLLLYNFKTKNLKSLITYNEDRTSIFVRDIIQSNKNEYWISSESGIYIYNIKTQKITHLKKEFNNPYSLSDNAIYPLLRDNEGGIWAGTYFGGVNYYSSKYAVFTKYFPQQNIKNGLSGNAVREIKQDNDGNIWIGTEDAGLNKLNPKTGIYQHYTPNGTLQGVSYPNIQGLLVDGNKLWVGTFEHGIDVLDIQTGNKLKHYDTATPNSGLQTNFVISFVKTKTGKIYLTTVLGLHVYLPETDNFKLVTSIPSLFYDCLMEDSMGNLWLGGVGTGLYQIQANTNRVIHFEYKVNDPKSISHNVINNIFQDKNHNIWVSTDGGGLCEYNPAKQNFNRYCTKDGLPSNFVFRVEQDKLSRLWISTTKGLVCFNPQTKDMITYSKASGILSDQFNYNSSLTDKNGTMYFGSVKGMISFDPLAITESDKSPDVYITGLQIHNEEVSVGNQESPLSKSISFTKAIELDDDESSFSLDFAALNYNSPELTQYAYKLKGLEKDWTYLESNRKVYFTKLPAGSYTFEVKAANASGKFLKPPTELKINVLPPFYASIWAYLIYFLIFTTIAYFLIKNYLEKIKAKNQRKIEVLNYEKEKEVYQAKIQFFTNITHEIRTPLTLIKGPLEMVKNAKNLGEIKENVILMEKNTTRLLNLTNQLLDFRKTEINSFSLNFVKVNITDLCQETLSRFKPIANEKGLSFSLKTPSEDIYAFADVEALSKILSNLFNNCIKYADSFAHAILSNLDDEIIKIEFINDGNIVPQHLKDKIFEPFYRVNDNDHKSGTGLGLSLAKSLAELHNGNLEFNPNTIGMNVFELTIPQHQENEIMFFEPEVEQDKEEDFLPDNQNTTDTFNVLIVDDHKDIRDFIAKEIAKEYTVILATNGKEALAILQERAINLIISDVMMPEVDGFELCKIIKNDIEQSHIPIILLTAKNGLQAKIEGLDSGADAYIEKPFSPEHLNVQVANLLKNRDSLRTHYANSPLVHLKTMAHSKADEKFLEKLNEVIIDNMNNNNLDVKLLADKLNISKPTLYRKIKSLSDLSPNELINVTRLKKAAELLLEGSYKIYEISDIVGYNSQAYFGKNFQKQFGMSPSEFIANKKIEN